MLVYNYWCGELPHLTEVAKMPKKTLYVGSKSFKVVEFGANRTGIDDFPSVINIHLYSHRIV